MRWLGFGDDSDWKIAFHRGKDGRFYWSLVDEHGVERALPPFRGRDHGFETEDEAIEDARAVARGLGADPDDLDVQSEDDS